MEPTTRACALTGNRTLTSWFLGDFDLADAFDDGPKKPTPTPKKPGSDDGFSLEDAVGGGGHSDPGIPAPPRPKPNPNPKQPETSGGFSDSDLLDGTSGGAEPQGVIPGIIGAVVVAVAGAISSFIAYQKKKLCFKENGPTDTCPDRPGLALAFAPVGFLLFIFYAVGLPEGQAVWT
ncbi:CD99 antigen [Myotis brandtii]|uniref:CD99 antigen n=1 Tax=Myotis brandtii TaxID=109478 RepID=S7N0V9_MYOBR|nr:CD99 antigen [Myotis brandtii]